MMAFSLFSCKNNALFWFFVQSCMVLCLGRDRLVGLGNGILWSEEGFVFLLQGFVVAGEC